MYATGQESGNASTGIAFSRDGRTIAVGCTDRLIRIWDVQAGAELPPLSGHKDSLRAVVFSEDGKTLVSFGKDNQVLAWPVAALRRPWPAVPEGVAAADVQTLWEHLRGEDRFATAHAIRLLSLLPAESLPLMRGRVNPVKRVDSGRIAKLVEDLRSEDFNERKKVARELRQFGDLALPALRKATERGSDEIIAAIRDKQQSYFPTREQIHALNAVQVLEVMTGDEARKHLEQIAAGADEALLTRAARAALERRKAASPAGLEEGQPEALWAALAGEDARKAYRAMQALARQPKDSVRFLRDKLRPLAAQEMLDDDPRRVARLIADLDAKAFATRQKAAKELERLGKRIEPMIRKGIETAPVLEVRKRLEELLQHLGGPKVSPERLQAERALEVLERVGGAETRQVLEDLVSRAKNAWVQEMLAAALDRVKRGP